MHIKPRADSNALDRGPSHFIFTFERRLLPSRGRRVSEGMLENVVPAPGVCKLWPENQALHAVDFSGAAPMRMLSAFLNGQKKSKEEEDFTTHEADVKFTCQFRKYNFVPARNVCLCTAVCGCFCVRTGEVSGGGGVPCSPRTELSGSDLASRLRAASVFP